MKKMKEYNILALVGKAGSGKDTILRKAIEWEPDLFNEIISCTTRPPREGEVDGINYYFLTDEDFNLEIEANLMLEYAEFNNWKYGTEIKALNPHKVNLGIFNPEGILSLTFDPRIDLKVIYVQANDKERVLRQLYREENPNVKEIVRRFGTDEADFRWLKKIKHYDVNNESLIQFKDAVNTVIRVAQNWDSLGKTN